MAPRFMPGEYALVEPTIPPDLEDDVLVRLSSGETMLTRLLSRRGGITLGAYNSVTRNLFREDEISWMYYVAHPIPARRVEQTNASKPLTKPRFDLK
jgi:phage repressor protein C with HTH and peptisase S24 domain